MPVRGGLGLSATVFFCSYATHPAPVPLVMMSWGGGRRRERRQGDDGIATVAWRRCLQACMEAAVAETEAVAMALVVVAAVVYDD